MPVVVNVSQGMNAGAHDGKSMLEVAFDEFSKGGRQRGRVIVKSAGNERHKYDTRRSHFRPSRKKSCAGGALRRPSFASDSSFGGTPQPSSS